MMPGGQLSGNIKWLGEPTNSTGPMASAAMLINSLDKKCNRFTKLAHVPYSVPYQQCLAIATELWGPQNYKCPDDYVYIWRHASRACQSR